MNDTAVCPLRQLYTATIHWDLRSVSMSNTEVSLFVNWYACLHLSGFQHVCCIALDGMADKQGNLEDMGNLVFTTAPGACCLVCSPPQCNLQASTALRGI